MNIQTIPTMHKQRGIVLTFVAVALMLVVSILTFYTANAAVNSQKLSANFYHRLQAFEAAEAGIDFGLSYLLVNGSSILVNGGSGYIASYTFPSGSIPTLTNGATFTITYSNPTQNDFSLIRITAVGKSPDGIASRTIFQLVKSQQLLKYNPWAATALSGFNTSGIGFVLNDNYNSSIRTGGTNNTTGILVTDGGTITQNDATLPTDPTDFYNSYFNSSLSQLQSKAQGTNTYYNNSSTRDYTSDLSGTTGKVIYINQTGGTATLNGIGSIGSSANPVVIIVNGPLSIGGLINIYGVVYINPASGGGSNNFTLSGIANIDGALISGGNATISGLGSIDYNSTVISNLNSNGSGPFLKVPASWGDL